jgi:putative oxidoreductase
MFFSDSSLSFKEEGLAILRIITGLLMAYHGIEALDSSKIAEYSQWDSIRSLPYPYFMAALGKWVELIGGLLLAAGLFTRLAALAVAGVMLFICFKLGTGKFYYDDQHPFLFVLLTAVWFLLGSGPWSLDRAWKKRRSF